MAADSDKDKAGNRGDDAAGEPAWKVDKKLSEGRLAKGAGGPGGRLVYVDERGRYRRLPADMSELTPVQVRAATAALSSALGAPDPGYARTAALERLAEMRAAGTVGEADYQRERRRLAGGG